MLYTSEKLLFSEFPQKIQTSKIIKHNLISLGYVYIILEKICK